MLQAFDSIPLTPVTHTLPSASSSLIAFWSIPWALCPVRVALFPQEFPLFKHHHLRKVPLSRAPSPASDSLPSVALYPQGQLCVSLKHILYASLPSCLSLPPEPKAYSALLEDSTERPLCPVAGQTSLRSGLLILESAGEGEGRQDGRRWQVSRACPLQFVLCWSPHFCSHSRAKGILQQQPQHLCGLSFYPWPAQVESHVYWGAPPSPLQIRTSQPSCLTLA